MLDFLSIEWENMLYSIVTLIPRRNSWGCNMMTYNVDEGQKLPRSPLCNALGIHIYAY